MRAEPYRRHKMMKSSICRLLTGEYLAPPGSVDAGKRVPVVAYLIRHPDGTLLFDTGFPFDRPTSVRERDFEIRVYPRSLDEELATVGSRRADVDLAANCHLHIDHAGGNFRLSSDIPIYVQEDEYRSARAEQDPVVSSALALDEARYERITGTTEILCGITALPTPGHTPGHQSLLVQTPGGPVLLAGQAVGSAAAYASAVTAYQLWCESGRRADAPADFGWLATVEQHRPIQVWFAHDLAIWERK